MKDKIVLLGPYPPPYGGVSIYISALFEYVKDHGVQLWTYGEREFAGPNVQFMKNKRRQLLPLLLREGRNARIADCTHFLLEYPSAMVPAWVSSRRMLKFEWIKLVHDGSLPSRYETFSPARRQLFRMAIRGVTEFVVANEDIRSWLVNTIGVKQKTTVIKTVLGTVPCEEQIELPGRIESAAGAYLNRPKKVCSIGAFISEYGFAHVAEALEKLRGHTGEDIGLLLLDGGFAEAPEFRKQVLRGRDWITVLKNVEHPLVFQLLKRSDVFVRAFGLESYGISRVEAIWAGVPVIATNVGETRGMLTYEFGDVDELERQLIRALFEPHTRYLEQYAALFRREAEENLNDIKRVLGVA